jgi:hypothetical protein
MRKHFRVPPFGGWPTFNHFYVQHLNRGCPILAFFARVGVDDACAIDLLRSDGNNPHAQAFPGPTLRRVAHL